MGSLAILDALANFLSSDIPANSTLAQRNASHAADDSPHPFSNVILSIFPFASIFLSLAIRNRDMLQLAVIGGLIETSRRLTYWTWDRLLNAWCITAYFEDSDDTYSWMMVWLRKENQWAKARDVYISTESWGQPHHKGVEIPTVEGDGRPGNSGYQTKRRLAYLPAFATTRWVKYKGTWISVTRTKTRRQNAGSYDESMQICLFTRDHRVLRSLLQDAMKEYSSSDQDVEIYGARENYEWEWHLTSTRKKRPLQSIILELEIKNMVLDDAKEFLSSRKWYTDRGIPYRRGYLLHGVPGSGKSSLIHSIAGELGLNIYVISIAKKGLDDASLNELICKLPLRSIVLMEDIDAAFPTADAREDPSGSTTKTFTTKDGTKDSGLSNVTLSGLLNALDGVAAQEGRILFATTNCHDSLDPALCRPGRMDVHVEFTMATRWQAKELFRCFFSLFEAEVEEQDDVGVPNNSAKGMALATRLTLEEIDALAEKFADAVPEGQFSMASLQGHLMGYKERPQDAADSVPAWVEKKSQEQRRGEAVKKQSA